MQIGELSKKSGVPKDTIRFYEQLGLLQPAMRNAQSRYRYYTNEAIHQLNLIGDLKELGFTLSEIGKIVQLRPTENCAPYKPFIREKAALLEKRIRELTIQKLELERSVSECPGNCGLWATIREGLVRKS